MKIPGNKKKPGLFSSNELIEFVLEADWDTLDDDRSQENEERPGLVHWTGPDGREVTIPIEVKARGSSRLQKTTCSFPGLSEGNQRTAVRYLEGFYEIIKNQRSTRRQITGACRR